MPSVELSPRQRIDAECRRRGSPAFAAGCVRLLHGQEVDMTLVVVLGGPHARELLARDLPEDQRSWLRVWAARGLLWAYDDQAHDDQAHDDQAHDGQAHDGQAHDDQAHDDGALAAVREALLDPAWRVREMAAKVVARHELGDLIDVVAVLRADPVPRVAAAAARALVALTRSTA